MSCPSDFVAYDEGKTRYTRKLLKLSLSNGKVFQYFKKDLSDAEDQVNNTKNIIIKYMFICKCMQCRFVDF